MNESEIPIDIHTSKLMEWLISRRHIPNDWTKRVMIVREKINAAIKDMPEDKRIASLLSGSCINYYHCKKIVEVLKETEVDSKNIFGQYTSKRMKDWIEVVRLYEKDNIYLGEVASLLQRNVVYEVPALRKQMSKATALISEFEKKEVTYGKMAETILKDFNSTCKSLGIEGVNVKKELIEKAKEFPQMCADIAKKIEILKPSVSIYEKVFKSFLSSKKIPLETLQYIIDNGNTTVYQWKYKKVPEDVELVSYLEKYNDDNEIKTENAIDFGIDTDINLDDNIDWGISVVESDEKVDISVNEVTEEKKNIAKGEEAYSILGHPDTRNLVLDDVLELEAFLNVRIHEMNSETDSLGLLMLPEPLQMLDIKVICEMLKSVQDVKQSLINPVFLHYLNITTNQKYVEQLTDKLKQKLNNYEKALLSKDSIKVQKAEAMKEASAFEPKVSLIIQKSKELQSMIEEDISKKYKGRPVNLIAGANIL